MDALSTNKAQMMEGVKKLLGKKVGKKIKDETIVLNTNFEEYLGLKSFAEICGFCEIHTTPDDQPLPVLELKCVQKALSNLRAKGLNKALASLSEHSQLSAFLSKEIEDSGGGVNQKAFDKLMGDS